MVLLFQKEGKNIWRSKLFFLVSIYPLSQGRQNYLTEHCFLCRHIFFQKEANLFDGANSFILLSTNLFQKEGKTIRWCKIFFFLAISQGRQNYLMKHTLSFYCRHTCFRRKAKLFDGAKSFFLLSTYPFSEGRQNYLMEQTLSFYCRHTSFRRKAKLLGGAPSFFFLVDIHLSEGRQNYLIEQNFFFYCQHSSFRRKAILLKVQNLYFYCRHISFRWKAFFFFFFFFFFCRHTLFRREAKLFDGANSFL